MPANQSNVQAVTDKLDKLNSDELHRVRDYADNRLHEVDTDGSSRDNDLKNLISDMDADQLVEARENINDRLLSMSEGQLASTDESADDEKKKYIAQHGANPNAQLTSQDVPEPSDQEGKDLQDEKNLEEHVAKGPAADGSHDPNS